MAGVGAGIGCFVGLIFFIIGKLKRPDTTWKSRAWEGYGCGVLIGGLVLFSIVGGIIGGVIGLFL